MPTVTPTKPDDDDDDDGANHQGGVLAEIFTPQTARTIKRYAPWVAVGLLALMVMRN